MEASLYLIAIIGFIYWVWTSTTVRGVLLRVLLSSVLGVVIVIITSAFIHGSGFPFKWLDEGSQKIMLDEKVMP